MSRISIALPDVDIDELNNVSDRRKRVTKEVQLSQMFRYECPNGSVGWGF